jgi:hypothetical protein
MNMRTVFMLYRPDKSDTWGLQKEANFLITIVNNRFSRKPLTHSRGSKTCVSRRDALINVPMQRLLVNAEFFQYRTQLVRLSNTSVAACI